MQWCFLLVCFCAVANTWAQPTGYTTVDENEVTDAENATTTTPPTENFTVNYSLMDAQREAFIKSLNLEPPIPRNQCGRRFTRTPRIVGGSSTKFGEFPWAVSVRLLTTHYCGGVIINQYWILTAAHCARRYSARYFRVRVGDNDIAQDGFRSDLDIHVDVVSIHPSFGNPRRYSNDLALLKLSEPLTYSPIAQPICLPKDDQDLEGRNATVVGWGWMNEIDKVKSEVLQKVQVPIVNNSICETWYSDVHNAYIQIYDYQICAGYKEGGKDACQGDSGGPLVMKEGDRYSVIGIVSAGLGCGRQQLPGIYSRVSRFVPWIQEVTGVGI